MGTPHIVGITAADQWLYCNPFEDARPSDDEIAVTTVLERENMFMAAIAFIPLRKGVRTSILPLY